MADSEPLYRYDGGSLCSRQMRPTSRRNQRKTAKDPTMSTPIEIHVKKSHIFRSADLEASRF